MTESAIPGAQAARGDTKGMTRVAADGSDTLGATQGFPVPGHRYSDGAGGITIEPTYRGDRDVQLWTYYGQFEMPMLCVSPEIARALARDLLERADLIDPEGDS